jgi:hypothetical protein
MIPPRLTTSARVEQIRAAIVRVKESREHFRLVSIDPGAESLRIDCARESFVAAVKEFGWQCENVEAVLDALEPGEK